MPQELNSSLKKAVKGTTFVLVGMVVSQAIWFAAKVLIVRSITKEEFGIYALTLTIVNVLSAVALLGIQDGATRYIARFLSEGRKDDADSVSRATLHVMLVSGIVTFGVLYSLSDVFARHIFYKPELAAPLKVFSFLIPFTVMTGITVGILRGHGIVRPKVYYQDIGHPLYFLIFLVILLFFGITYMSIIYAFTVSAALVFVSISCYGYKKVRLSPMPLRGGRYYGKMFRFSLPLLFAGLSSMVLNWTDALMLGRYTGAEDVGVYNVGISLARLMVFPLGALSFVYMPLAGEMYHRQQRSELKRAHQVLTKWVFFTTLPLFSILFFFPEMTITFLFGERLVDAAIPLRILALGYLFHVFMGANGVLIVVLGRSTAIMKTTIFAALLNIVLNYILIKQLGLGVVGASTATVTSLVVLNLILAIIVFRESGIHSITSRYLWPAAGAAVIGAGIYALVKSLPFFSLWLMPLYLVVFVGGYTLTLLLSRSVDEEDLQLFSAVTRRLGLKLHWLRRVLERFAHKH